MNVFAMILLSRTEVTKQCGLVAGARLRSYPPAHRPGAARRPWVSSPRGLLRRLVGSLEPPRHVRSSDPWQGWSHVREHQQAVPA